VGAAPERTCVGCRGKAPKAALIRLVRGLDGRVEIDERAVAPGRGAYLHRDRSCVEAALRKGALARAMRTGVGPEEVGRLGAFLERMLRDT
jgi:predicted RNA-binding protein YlxR (DUF448 family)